MYDFCLKKPNLCPKIAPKSDGKFDWAFKFNEATYESLAGINPPTILPSSFDYTGFDWNSGLGTITVAGFGTGSNTFLAFFDHEIDEPLNTFFNEYGDVSGTPATGQSWEIDEPDYVFGNIYANLLAGSLDNSNGVPSGSPDDVSMAMGWGFALNPGESAMISLILGTTQPISGFYLSHTDPDSNAAIYFSGILNITGAVPVPEPTTLLLLGSGVAGLVLMKRRIRN